MITIVSMTWAELKELLKDCPDDHVLHADQTLEDAVFKAHAAAIINRMTA